MLGPAMISRILECLTFSGCHDIFGDLWISLEIWGSECQDACHKVLQTTFSSLAAYQKLQVYIALQNLISDIRSVIPLHLA